MNMKSLLKPVLWFLVGMLATTTLLRFALGLGATTALNDATPWGLWIAFDVMSGVALAAGGFVIAAAVHIFGKESCRGFARPAVLTAFLGYAAVAVSLLYDLGIPFHIWHPLVYPQAHSVLFEVAMCVMLYLTVLFLEICPVMLEHPCLDKPFLRKIHGLLRKVTVPLVILGVVLSTLHQSSLGSLFLIAPQRVHPLWYSPWIWVFFLFSAVGLGLSVVILESLFSRWYFGHSVRIGLLAGLARIASFVLLGYVALRTADLAFQGSLGALLQDGWERNLFLLEMGLVLIPSLALLWRAVRFNLKAIAISSIALVLGVLGYRFNVSLVAFVRPEGVSYFPSWIELVVTLGLVAAFVLIFIFFVEHFRIFPKAHEEKVAGVGPSPFTHGSNPLATNPLLPESLASAHRYSWAFVVGACLAMGFFSSRFSSGSLMIETPVAHPIELERRIAQEGGSPDFPWPEIDSHLPDAEKLMMLDGNRNGRLVIFAHEGHQQRLGFQESCRLCHHKNLPLRSESSCSHCHSDMFLKTDIFNHLDHIGKLQVGKEQQDVCSKCHLAGQTKTREATLGCWNCHESFSGDSELIDSTPEGTRGWAPSYRDAMHGVCLNCHRRLVLESPDDYPASFSECRQCHRQVPVEYLNDLQPYKHVGTPGLTGVAAVNGSELTPGI